MSYNEAEHPRQMLTTQSGSLDDCCTCHPNLSLHFGSRIWVPEALLPLPQEAVGKADTLDCRRSPQFPIPQTCLAVWNSWQLLSDLLHQVIPSSPLIGLRTLAATDLLPSFPLSPLWQTHRERETRPLLFTQLHTPLQAFQSHSCSPPSPHPPPAPTLPL